MTSFRYKAFISYSHRDEQWGRWLQRALENYRVPRRMVGAQGDFGVIPRRLSPVFRDREDLSSAADLSTSVKAELEASENLVVICSPSAAASPWVNEEVKYFRELGRGERILALIVDGDPQSVDPAEQCFPPALTQSVDGRPHEPLAADARKWADGKSLARLKLVAGILGIRLDDLRRRDMQRKHRLWMISGSGAMAIALLTTVLAVVAITARNQSENRRQHAEDLVDYMVDDLKQKLDEVGRLDILEGVGDEVSTYLATLDPREETEESLLQKAKVWRQLGEVSMNQGKLDGAMEAFSASRDVTGELLRRAPTNTERIYEMAQSEFWVGFVDLERGDYVQAQNAFDQYLLLAESLVEMEPGNSEWVMEQSYAHGNIATLLIRKESDDAERILREVELATELNRKALEIDPESQRYLSELGNAIAWMADTQLLFCDLGGALKSRQENVDIALEAVTADPGNTGRQRRYAWSLSGLSKVAMQVGLIEFAIEHLARSVKILEEISGRDPSNLDLRWDAVERDFHMVYLLAATQPAKQVLSRLAELRESMKLIIDQENTENLTRAKQWVDFQLGYSEIAWRLGQTELAAELWKSAIEQITAGVESEKEVNEWRDEIVKARFLLWHWTNESGQAVAGDLQGSLAQNGLDFIRLESGSTPVSCEDRGLLVLQALEAGDMDEARANTGYLLGKGYFEPGFMRICRQYGLCQEEG